MIDQSHVGDAELEDLIDSLNEKLRAAGADSAERAFGIGCLLGLVPTVGIILVLFIFKVINVILVFVLTGLASLVVLGSAMLLSYQARLNSIRREYQHSVKADIDHFLIERKISRQQFDRLVHPLLTEDSPLAVFLVPDNLDVGTLDVPENEELG